ncbi:hypothetical protein [Geopseudomonas aromaticivorans]
MKHAIFAGLCLLASGQAMAAQMLVHDAVVVNDGGTRLLSCENSKGHFMLYAPIASEEAYVVRSNLRDTPLSDVFAQVLPNGWTVRYISPGVENQRVNLSVDTYWADAVKILAHDFNFVTVVDGEKRQVVVGRL